MNITLNKNDDIVMRLLHYFITVENYNPVVLHGAKDEIWLENSSKDYKIVRIVSNYIHNNEQLDFDMFRTRQILKRIRVKMFSFKIETLSIFVNLGDNVDLKKTDYQNIEIARVNEINDLTKYSFIMDNFPNILSVEDINMEGMELFLKLTEDINKKNIDEAKKAEDVFTKKKPVMTYIFMGICILMYLIVGAYSKNFFQLDPNVLNDFNGLVNIGYITSINDLIVRLISGMFLHAGLIHLLCNMYSLYIIGPQLESFYGKAKFSIIYIGSGLIASILSMLFLTDGYVSVGASGALFGLIGALIYFGYHYRVYLSGVMRSQLVPLIFLNFAISCAVPGIDYMAHIGGFVGGLLLAKAVGVKYKSTKSEMINGIIMTLIFVISLFILLFR